MCPAKGGTLSGKSFFTHPHLVKNLSPAQHKQHKKLKKNQIQGAFFSDINDKDNWTIIKPSSLQLCEIRLPPTPTSKEPETVLVLGLDEQTSTHDRLIHKTLILGETLANVKKNPDSDFLTCKPLHADVRPRDTCGGAMWALGTNLMTGKGRPGNSPRRLLPSRIPNNETRQKKARYVDSVLGQANLALRNVLSDAFIKTQLKIDGVSEIESPKMQYNTFNLSMSLTNSAHIDSGDGSICSAIWAFRTPVIPLDKPLGYFFLTDVRYAIDLSVPLVISWRGAKVRHCSYTRPPTPVLPPLFSFWAGTYQHLNRARLLLAHFFFNLRKENPLDVTPDFFEKQTKLPRARRMKLVLYDFDKPPPGAREVTPRLHFCFVFAHSCANDKHLFVKASTPKSPFELESTSASRKKKTITIPKWARLTRLRTVEQLRQLLHEFPPRKKWEAIFESPEAKNILWLKSRKRKRSAGVGLQSPAVQSLYRLL